MGGVCLVVGSHEKEFNVLLETIYSQNQPIDTVHICQLISRWFTFMKMVPNTGKPQAWAQSNINTYDSNTLSLAIGAS